MESRSQRLCRLCEFPAADGAVPLDALDADKLAAWWRCTLDAEFKIETGAEQLRSLICQFCICEARFVHKHSQDNCSCGKKTGCDWWTGHGDDHFFQHYYYQQPLIQPCKVVLEKISSDYDHLGSTNIAVNAIQQSNAHVQNNLEGLNPLKVELKLSKIEAKSASNLYVCTLCYKRMNSHVGLYLHMKKSHKNCVRCRKFRCATYFSTETERQEHEYKFHLNGAFNKVVKCNFCSALLSNGELSTHIKRLHKEAIKCNFYNYCHQYFHTESEKDKHIVEAHSQGTGPKLNSPDGNNSYFQAKMLACQASQQVEKQLSISPNTTNIVYQCSLCFKIVKNFKYFTIHLRKTHKYALFRCNSRKCAKYFSTEVERQQHEEEFHLNAKHKAHCVKCIYCGALILLCSEGSLRRLTSHMKMQHKEAIKCDYQRACPNYFLTESEKNEHIVNEHTQGRKHKLIPMKCIYCETICKNKYQLGIHVNEFHKDVRIKCRVKGCVIFFQSQTEREEHYLQVHKNAESLKKFHCLTCSFKSNYKISLIKHLQIVHLNKSSMKSMFKCPQCSKSFHTKSYLKKHLNGVHAERCTCQYCGKTLRKKSLSSHYSFGSCKPFPI